MKALEDEGFQFEGAEASFELLMERVLGRHQAYFELLAYRVIVEEQGADGEPVAEATVRVRVKGLHEHTAASGNGPVDALDHALARRSRNSIRACGSCGSSPTRCAFSMSPRERPPRPACSSRPGDNEETWGTVGVADNIIEASWQALVDAVEYKLGRDDRRSADAPPRWPPGECEGA